MERFEADLKQSLRRTEPSAAFTERSMSRVRGSRRFGWRWIAAGAVAASMVVGAWIEHAKIERRRAETAQTELLWSLQVAGLKIDKARQAVLQSMKEDSL